MKIGFLVNPIAGMGGSVALKGTDGEETLRRALELGAVPKAGHRAAAALREFQSEARLHEFLAPEGVMGAELLRAAGIEPEIIYTPQEKSTSEDTKKAAAALAEAGAQLLIFAGGDGTARDLCSVLGEHLPVVGIPAGVKIHSGVYAKKPEAAGKLIKKYLKGNIKHFITAEVMDIDEEAFRDNIVRARLYGYMQIPDDREFMQERKSGGTSSAEEAANLAASVAGELKQGTLYLIGSGSTTMKVLERLGLAGTLLGVDAVLDGKLVGKDLSASAIKELLKNFPSDKRALIITIIGGQGHIFGRGNQQLSPEVLSMLPKENIHIIATSEKAAALFGKGLTADTGDEATDESFKGYIPVITGHSRKIMMKVI